MIIDLNVQEPYYSLILAGTKKVEGRLNKGVLINLEIGNIICFNKKSSFVVISIQIYSSFREMLTMEGIKNVIPLAKNLDEAESVYYQFYNKEDEQKYGVIGISLKDC